MCIRSVLLDGVLDNLSQHEWREQSVGDRVILSARRGPDSGACWNAAGHAMPSGGLPWCGPSVFLSVPITVTSIVLRPGAIHSVTSHSHGRQAM